MKRPGSARSLIFAPFRSLKIPVSQYRKPSNVQRKSKGRVLGELKAIDMTPQKDLKNDHSDTRFFYRIVRLENHSIPGAQLRRVYSSGARYPPTRSLWGPWAAARSVGGGALCYGRTEESPTTATRAAAASSCLARARSWRGEELASAEWHLLVPRPAYRGATARVGADP